MLSQIELAKSVAMRLVLLLSFAIAPAIGQGVCTTCEAESETGDLPPQAFAMGDDGNVIAVVEVFANVGNPETAGDCVWIATPFTSVCGKPETPCKSNFYAVVVLTDVAGDSKVIEFTVTRSGRLCGAAQPPIPATSGGGSIPLVNGEVEVDCGTKCEARLNVDVSWRTTNLSPPEENESGSLDRMKVRPTFKCASCQGVFPN